VLYLGSLWLEQFSDVRFEQRRGRISPLDETARLNEVPTFAMAERRVSNSLEKMGAFLDAAKEQVWRCLPFVIAAGALVCRKS